MTIKTRLNFEEYKKLIFILIYKKPIVIFITVLGLYMIVHASLSYFGIIRINNNITIQFIFGIIITFLIPYNIYKSSKKNFETNKRIQEEIEYNFTNEKIIVKGESFNLEHEWNKITRIKELKDCFLIYQSKTSADIIPKRNLLESEIQELRNIFNQQKNIRLNSK